MSAFLTLLFLIGARVDLTRIPVTSQGWKNRPRETMMTVNGHVGPQPVPFPLYHCQPGAGAALPMLMPPQQVPCPVLGTQCACRKCFTTCLLVKVSVKWVLVYSSSTDGGPPAGKAVCL